MKSLNEYLLLEAKDNVETYFLAISGKKKISRDAQQKLYPKMEKDVQTLGHELRHSIDSKLQDALDIFAGFGEDYTNINKELRSGKISKKYKGVIDTIDNGFHNKLKNDLLVYRASDSSTFSDTVSFKSTSINPATASNFARGGATVKRFKIPKNTPYIYLDTREYEVLFPRDLDLSKYEY